MKTVLVTGSTSGIGEAASRRLAADGYRLVLVARNQQKLEKLCRELGPNVHSFAYDLYDLEHIHTIFDYCREREFAIDGLVYCAGISRRNAFRTINIEVAERVMRLNCMAFVEMGRMMALRKYSADSGSIVAISSLSATTAYAGTATYTMSKAALNAVCRVLSKELLKRRIRVNTIMPGYVRTPMTEDMNEEQVVMEQPFGFIEPEEIADVIEFLLSDKSRCITGAAIPVSAGMNFC